MYERGVSQVKCDPFEEFYAADVRIISIKETGGYLDTQQITELCTLKADIQSYGGGLAEKDYGLTVECQKRMYCVQNDNLTEGNYAEANGKRYKLVYVDTDDMGAMALLREVRV